MSKDFLWVEKYRPKTIADCILPVKLKTTFQQFVDDGFAPNVTLSGGPGIGKTTVAKAMLDELGCDHIIINGSLNAGIDVLRNDIQNYASSCSFSGGKKYVILDEADYLSAQHVQPALREFIEHYSENCGFILTCNYPNKILPALLSRCPPIRFEVTDKDKLKLAGQFLKRAMGILDENKVTYEASVVAQLIQKFYPDWRRVLNELQRHSAGGKIDSSIFSEAGTAEFEKLFDFMKNRRYTELRGWIGENANIDSTEFYEKLFEQCELSMTLPGQAQSILTIAKYQYQASFVACHELNNLACLVELMIQDGVWS